MNKKILLYLLAVMSVLGIFTSCNDDDDMPDDRASASGEYWEKMSGVYRGKMYVEIDGVAVDTIYQQLRIASDDRNRMTLSMSSLVVGDMVLNDVFFKNAYFTADGQIVGFKAETVQKLGQIPNVTLEAQGTVRENEMELKMVAHSVTMRAIHMRMKAGRLEKIPGQQAEIKKMILDHPLVISQPILQSYNSVSGYRMVFYVPDTLKMDSTEILVKPVFELSEGATISWPDSVMDFSKEVTYTVWAEDSIHRNVYKIQWAKAMIRKYEFNRWEMINGREEPADGWATNNAALGTDGGAVVTRVKGMNVGEWASEMRTMMTGEGKEQRIFAGSFFQGQFDLLMNPPLYGPVYGVPSLAGYAPSALKGYYKYLPSENVYVGSELLQDTLKVRDTCCIRAILFEIVNPDDRLDSVNYMNDPKVVAIAEMGRQAGQYQPAYTEFSIYFNYIRSFFVSKRYKIAMICSSSRDADKLRGAPGSLLTVGGIEVMYFNAGR